ncbi:MAG: hypothetical protein AAFZ07_06630 [Actinomycetota bacterium]
MHGDRDDEGGGATDQQLRWLPSAWRDAIDRSELVQVTPVQAWRLASLGRRIDARIVAYRSGAAGRHGGPCSYLDAARLEAAALAELRDHEVELGLTLVAYER